MGFFQMGEYKQLNDHYDLTVNSLLINLYLLSVLIYAFKFVLFNEGLRSFYSVSH